MKVIIVKNYEEASQEAAKIFINQVKENPQSILGLATGSTPIRMYELLREDHEKNHTSYKDVKSYNLDEYFGLDASHPQSYHYFMYKNLFNGIDIKDENVHVPCGQGNIQENCDEYNTVRRTSAGYIQKCRLNRKLLPEFLPDGWLLPCFLPEGWKNNRQRHLQIPECL